LYAINPSGTLKWKYATGDYVDSSPAIGSDGTIFAPSYDGYLYAINPSGTLKWKYDVDSRVFSSPVIGNDGSIFFGAHGNLYAINPSGTLKWKYATGDWIGSSPAIGSDGTIYVGSDDNNLYAINPSGTLKWKYATGDGITSSPAIGADGTIYVGSDDSKLYAINPSGSLKWKYVTGERIWSSPAIGADGTIYVGSTDNNLYAITPSGTLKWKYTTFDSVFSSPAIGADGTIYVGSWDNNLYAIGKVIDTENPTVAITSPSNGATVTSSSIMVYGSASDNVAVDHVDVKVNSGSWVRATGTTSWSKTVTLNLGSNTIYARATDTSGNTYIDQITITYSVPPEIPWPMFHHDVRRTGLSPYDTSQNIGTLKWKYTTDGTVGSSPAIGSDGTIYVGSNDDNLYAINPSGTLKWKYATGDGIRSSPAIGNDGTIYVGSDDSNLYAINPTGTLKWTYTTGGDIRSSPAIGNDGTIYVGSNDYNLYAINPTGTLKWKYTTGGWIGSFPAIGADGTIYVGSWDDNLYAINPSGTLKWKYATGGSVASSPAIGSEGTIYISSSNDLYAINPDGTLKWSYTTDGYIASSPAIGADGTIYVGSGDGNLYAINPTGTLKWKYTTGGNVASSPAIGSEGTIYIGSYSDLYAINPTGTLKWKYTIHGHVSSPAIGSDGTTYIGSTWDGKLYAIGPLPSIFVTVTASPSTIVSGETSTITVQIKSGITSMSGATVILSSNNGGTLSPSSGTTNSNGYVTVTFTAPTVTSQTTCRITAQASKSGYTSGSNYVDVTVNPQPSLTVTVTASPSTIVSGETSTITVQIKSGITSMSGATVILSSNNGGTLSPSSGTTNSNGYVTVTFTAPTVTSQTTCRITAQASKSGYTSGSNYVDVTVNPQPSFILTVIIYPIEGGLVIIKPEGKVYYNRTEVNVTAVANSSYVFSHWSGDTNGTVASIEILIDENKTVIAHFVANQKPTVSINTPSNNSEVSGDVAVMGIASDDISVEKVEIKIDDGNWIQTTGTTSWSYSWDTTTVNNGSHTIYARSYDGTDYSSIVSVTVIVNNIPPNHKPTVGIIFPTDGTEVKKTFTIHGTASDDNNVEKVEIKIGDENWTIVDGTTTWNYSWDSTNMDNGDYVIQARAYDGQEYSNIDSIMVKVNNKEGGGGTPGFEMVALLVAMGAVLWVRKKK